MKVFKSAVIGALGLAIVTFSASALTVPLGYTFSGTSPSGTAPWATATFTDVSGGVQLTISASLGSGEFISKMYFNVDSSLLSSLSFARIANGTPAANLSTPSVTIGEDANKADGDGYYDIYMAFATSGSGRFQDGESIKFLITGAAGLDANDFNLQSVPGGGNGTYVSAAHVQGIPTGEGSGWIGDGAPPPPSVPDGASTLMLLGLAVMSFPVLRRTFAK